MAKHGYPQNEIDLRGFMAQEHANWSADGYTHINFHRFNGDDIIETIEGPRYQDITSHGGKVDDNWESWLGYDMAFWKGR